MGSSQQIDRVLTGLAAAAAVFAWFGPGYSATGAAVAALSGVLALLVVFRKTLTAPLSSLLTAAREYAAGNFRFRIRSDRQDCFGALARTFDELGEELERQGQQLTGELLQSREARQTAEESRAYLESALSHCVSGILVVSAPDHVIHFANQAALDLLGIAPTGGAHSPVRQRLDSVRLYLPDGTVCPHEQLPIMRALLAGEIVSDQEFRARADLSQPMWVSVNATPIRSDGGDVVGAVIQVHDVTPRRKQVEEIQQAAWHDSLTSLPNRASILKVIQEALDSADRNHLALLFMDFDRFKLINDSLGHETGDELLRQIAGRIRNTVRATDGVAIPARLGGDEFVVFLNHLPDVSHAGIIAARLLEELSKKYDLNGQTVCSTVSIGVVTSEHRFTSAADMLRDADLAMYQSKADGKGRYTVFDRSLRDQIQQRLALETDMRAGVRRDEFVLRYQPIVCLQTGEIAGAEGLARWMHPVHGELGATDFISIANETGLVVPIGDRFISDACAALAQWHQARPGSSELCVHVNVSRLQLQLPNLITVVEDALAAHRLPAQCLHLEVTEDVIMHDPDKAIERLNALREIGVRIDVDGFGSGYSSLACLHQFPIDILKLDRTFLHKVFRTPELLALLTAILNFADELCMKVVAAGVENQEQLALLRKLGCHYAQGYLFARPLTPEQMHRTIQSSTHLTRFELPPRLLDTAWNPVCDPGGMTVGH